jgi:hypothetical protein
VKKARRRKERPTILPLTQTAISKASAIEAGMVKTQNTALLRSACQKIGSSIMSR